MKELRWSVLAEADLFDIAERTGERGADAEQNLLEHILDTPLILLDFPALGAPVAYAGLRKWLVKNTPFLLLYRVSGNIVEVSRVLHAASAWANLH